MKNPISSQEWEQARDESIANDHITKNVYLSDISFSHDSLQRQAVSIAGKEVPVTAKFISDLAKLLNVNAKLSRDLKDSGFYGALLEAVKTNKANSKNRQITVVANANAKSVLGAYARYSRLSNGNLFKLAEDLIERHPGLYVSQVTGGTNPVIALRTDAETRFPRLGPDENFNFGIGLRNIGGGSDVGSFNYRLVCGNGMLSSTPELDFTPTSGGLTGIDSGSIVDFFNQIADIAGRDFVPGDFEDKLTLLGHTPASLYELERMYNTVVSHIDEADPDIKSMHERTIRTKWFWGIDETYERLNRKGVKDVTAGQTRLIRTPQPLWDVVNSLTNLGSNSHVEPLKNKGDLQITAGKLMAAKKYDLQDIAMLQL